MMVIKCFFMVSSLLLQLDLEAAILESPFKVTAIASLKSVSVPGPSEKMLSQFVKDKKAAIQLGKALFWDTRVGSGNKTACASCHFHAGVDNRVKNQLQPGSMAHDESFEIGGVNYSLTKKNFPFISLDDDKRGGGDGGEVDINDVVSSHGVFNSIFKDTYDDGREECENVPDAIFHGMDRGKMINTRRVEQRHTPSTINAVFNFRNFWDGRATNMFNGIDPFGRRNTGSYVWKLQDGKIQKVAVDLPSSSLASQASGPPLSGFEMSCKERQFHYIAKKLLYNSILMDQKISPTDSVLGELAARKPTYHELIEKAFHPEWLAANAYVPYAGAVRGSMDLKDAPDLRKNLDGDKITLTEANFSFYFSLAIQLYEATLVSDDSPFDHFAEGNQSALTPQQKRGLVVFQGPGQCIRCHSGPEFTSASFSSVNQRRILNIPIAPGKRLITDNGFFNIGVRPTKDDLGLGGIDPFGFPMSETRMVKNSFWHMLGNDFDPARNPRPSEINQTAVDGAFKVPSLRNVELTGPYFHNGGKATLMQVVELYDAGGDFAKENADNLAISALNLTSQQEDDLVAFLLSLTDERVRYKKAPFDHPSLCVTNGHHGSMNSVREDPKTGAATDQMFCLPEVGAQGVQKQFALRPFLGLSPFER